MKKTILIIALCVGLMSCGNNKTKNTENHTSTSIKDGVEVLYFHSKQRCATCLAIEKNAKEVIETEFAEALKKGKLVFKSLEIDENESLSDKYEITWSSLVLVDYDNGKESAENLTEFAFANARTAPDKFKAEIKSKIEKQLND